MVTARQRAEKAIEAMRELGISGKKVKPVLISLLHVYGNNWGHIEAENYRVLIDAIFESPQEGEPKDEEEAHKKKNKKEVLVENTESLSSDSSHSQRRACLPSSSGSSHTQRRASGSSSSSHPGENSGVTFLGRTSPLGDIANHTILVTDPCPSDGAATPLAFVLPTHPSSAEQTTTNLASVQNPCFTSLVVASSSSGKVKLSFTFVRDQHGFIMPNIQVISKMVEEKWTRFYNILDSNFSVMNILKDMCQCAQELDSEERKHSSTVARQPRPAQSNTRPQHLVNDVAKGEERVPISLVNEISNEQLPLSFRYMPQNMVYQNAYVNFSLTRIGDEDCCSGCSVDCLSAAIPCECARESGGEFAYTLDGRLKKEVLDYYILMWQNPPKKHMFYCKECPLERTKNEVTPDACKGHVVKKFVKECWSKCGCHKECGNRVVQRGITCKLQVFNTGGKGWGLRNLDELRRGAFVCEYIGEILTNMELYDRTILTTSKATHTYPVLLDSDWGSEGVLKDEEALCLDATFRGNVARFINHRCFDSNLIGIPVEVDTPDHHYYHLAFFTTRKVKAFEELTWDYGIDFDDDSHPIKAFQCCCGSEYCRGSRRPTKATSQSLVLATSQSLVGSRVSQRLKKGSLMVGI